MEEDSEYLKLPVEEQCVHKLWKARLKGYESAAKLFQQWEEKATEFSRYAPLIKKFVTDSNAVAQERGLEAALAFAENAHLAARVCGEVVSGIVQKAVAAPKTSTRDKARLVVLMFVEIEKYDVVQEELMKGFSHKNPKVVSGCVSTLTCALTQFGHTVLQLKSLLKQLPELMEHKDKAVREETKALVVELHRWIGAAIKPQLTNMKPVLVAEFETEFAKNSGARAQQSRYLRSQQQKQQQRLETADGEDGAADGEQSDGEAGAAAAAVDPLDLLEPFNVLAALPKDYHAQLESKKWQERRDALAALLDLVTKNPRVEPADYSEVVRGLRRVVTKDSNVMVVALAGQCVTGLARGLRRHYAAYAVATLTALLEKFKEKKQSVVAALRDACDAIFPSTTLEAIQEEVFTSLANKNPSVKSETATFLARSFCHCTPAVFTKKLLKAYLPELTKLLNDSDPAVRDAASLALATIWKVVGEKMMTAFLGDIERVKLDKIKEQTSTVELKVKVASAKVVKPPPAAAACKSQSDPVTAAAGGKKAGAKPVTRKPVSSSATFRKPSSSRPESASLPSQPAVVERELSEEESVQLVAELVDDGVCKQLSDANWKTRLAAIENVISVVGDRSDVPTQALLMVLSRKPGLRDNNFQVLRLKIQLVQRLAVNAKFSARCMEFCVGELVERLPDAKTGSVAADTLLCIGEAVSLETTGLHVLISAFALKSPKVHEHALLWLQRAIAEFGLAIKPKSMISYVRKALAHTAVAVRSAAVQLLGAVQLYTGPAVLRQLLHDEKPAIVELIDAEIQRLEGTRPPVPTRGVKASPQAPATAPAAAAPRAGPSDTTAGCALEDLVTRVDISDRLTSSLLAELSDKNWKVRSEALQTIADVIRQAVLIEPSIGELPQALAARCSDSNKNLAADALRVLAALAAALGSRHAPHQLRYLLSGAAAALADAKQTVRQAAVSALSAWSQHAQLSQLLATDELQQVVRTGSPTARAELYTWLAVQLRQDGVTLSKSDLQPYLAAMIGSVEDRSPDVRRAASDAIAPLMAHTGYEPLARAVTGAKLKPAAHSALMALLERERVSQAQAAPAAGATSGGHSVSQSLESLEEAGVASETAAKSSRGTARSGTVVRGKHKGRASLLPRGKSNDTEPELAAPLQLNTLKQQRIQDELRLRCLKWNFTSPRPEFIDQLKEQMASAGVADTLVAQMFHADFKQHLKAIETLASCVESSMAAVVSNLDLLMKWLTLRLFDTNPSVLIRGLELFHAIFQQLSDENYHLCEQEATAFVPYVMVKLGDPKEAVRASTRNIMRDLYALYPTSKMFVFVMDGLKSKNSRQRAECLEEVGYLVETCALGVCQPSPGAALREVARQIGDRDNNVRKAALNALVQAYYLSGDKLYKLIGNLSDKDLSLLEERIKRAPPKPVTPSLRPATASSATVPAAAAVTTSQSSGRVNSCDAEQSSDANQQQQPDADTAAGELADTGQQQLVVDRFADNAISRYAQQLEQQMPTPRLPDMGQLLARDEQRDEEISQLLSEPVISLPVSAHRDWGSHGKRTSTFESSDLQPYVAQLSDRDRTVMHIAVDRLNMVLKSEEPEALVDHACAILDAVRAHFAALLPLSSSSSACGNGADSSLSTLRDLSQLVILMLHYQCLAVPCSEQSLRQLFSVLLQVIAGAGGAPAAEAGGTAPPPPATAPAGHSDLLSVANKLILRLVDKANHTNAICALVTLLEQCVRGGGDCVPASTARLDSDYCLLLMKCLWKMVRSMEAWAAHDLLDTAAVLHVIDRFLVAFPSAWWRSASSDTPLRTVRTLLHRLATIYGYVILTKLGRVSQPHRSETMEFIIKVFSTNGGKPSAALTGDEASCDDTDPAHSVGPARHSDGDTDSAATLRQPQQQHSTDTDQMTPRQQLKLIFKKISSKESTKEGIFELYDFKRSHPDVDPAPFLDKCSSFFRNYVERGLKAVEQERMRTRAADDRAQENQPQVPAGQARFRLVHNKMKELSSRLPSVPARDHPDYDTALAKKQLALIDLVTSSCPTLTEPLQQLQQQLLQLNGLPQPAAAPPSLHQQHQQLLQHSLPTRTDESVAPLGTAIASPDRAGSGSSCSSSLIPSGARTPVGRVGGGGSSSRIPQPPSQMKPVADASEIEEYRRRLARLRRNGC